MRAGLHRPLVALDVVATAFARHVWAADAVAGDAELAALGHAVSVALAEMRLAIVAARRGSGVGR